MEAYANEKPRSGLFGLMDVIEYINENIDAFQNNLQDAVNSINQTKDDICKFVLGVKDIFAAINSLIESAGDINWLTLRWSFFKIENILNEVFLNVNKLANQIQTQSICSDISILEQSNQYLLYEINLLNSIYGILLAVSQLLQFKDIRISFLGLSKIKLIKILINRLSDALKEFDDLKQIPQINPEDVTNLFKSLNVILQSINDTKLFFIDAKIKTLMNAVDKIDPLIVKMIQITKIQDTDEAMKNMHAVSLLIKSFSSVIVSLLILAPLASLFVLLSPVIILMVGAASLVIYAIVKFVSYLITVRTVASIVSLIAVLGLLALVTLGILTLALLSDLVVKSLPNVIKLMLGIIAFTLLFAAFGLMVNFTAAFMLAGVVGLALVGTAIMALLLITAALNLITQISIDADEVKDKVKTILEIAGDIVFWIFTPMEEIDSENSDKPSSGILGLIGNGISNLIGSFLASAVLVSTVISVAAILLIASALRLIENLNLDTNKIQENVQTVLNTCQQITSEIFAPDSESQTRSNRSGLSGLIGWLTPELLPVIDAIMAGATLALMMFSVVSILAITAMLNKLQDLSLNEDKIRENVNKVLDLCHMITNSIFRPDEENADNSSRGILGSLMTMILPPISKVLDAIFSMAYLTVMVISTTMILGMAQLLSQIENINLNTDKTQERIKDIMDTCHMIISSIFRPDEENADSSSRGIMGSLLTWVHPGLGSLLDAIFSMAYLAVMMISVTTMLGVAKILEELSLLDPTIFDKARTNTEKIMDTVDYLRDCIFGRDEENAAASNRGPLMKVIAWVSGEGTAKMLEGILLIGNLAMMYFAVYLIAGLAKSMKQIGSIDVSTIQKAKINTDLIMKASLYMMNQILNGDYQLPVSQDENKLTKLLKSFVPRDLVAIADVLSSFGRLSLMEITIGAVSRIANDLNKISNIKYDANAAKTNTIKLLNATKGIMDTLVLNFDSVDKKTLKKFEPMMDSMSDIIHSISKMAENLNKIADIDTAKMAQAEKTAIAAFNHAKRMVSSVIGDKDDISWAEMFKQKIQFNRTTDVLKTSVNPMLKEMDATLKEINKMSLNVVKLGSINEEQIIESANIGQKTITTTRDIVLKYTSANNIREISSILTNQREAFQNMTTLITDGSNVLTQISDMSRKYVENASYSEEDIFDKSRTYKTSLSEFHQILDMASGIEPNPELVRSNMNSLDRISQTIGNFVKVSDQDVSNSRRITDNYAKFLMTVDKMDYQKLNTTAWMMRYWASISSDLKGDFEGLARTINQYIMPMLEKLNKTMTEATKCQHTIIDELTKPVDLVTGGSSLSGSNTPDTSSPVGPTNYTSSGATGSTGESGSATDGSFGRNNNNRTNEQQSRPERSNSRSQQRVFPPHPNHIDPERGKKYLVEFAKITEA